jgi:hypothetical protein
LTKKRSILIAIGLGTWLAVVGTGLSILRMYSLTPGVAGTPAAVWPKTSRIVSLADHPTLVMIVHPHCPCSRASIGELAILMAHSYGRLMAYVVFVDPPGFGETWTKSDLWSSAGSIPRVARIIDNGTEAKLFGAATSGQTMVYDRVGRLVFSGGITAARGHFGNNAGLSAIIALMNTASSSGFPHTAPFENKAVAHEEQIAVFGCPLFAPTAKHKSRQPTCPK